MNSTPEGAVTAVARLARLISDPDTRSRFLDAPEEALGGAGIDLSDVPENVLNTLKGLSYDELGVIASVGEELEAAGLYLNVPGVGTIWYF